MTLIVNMTHSPPDHVLSYQKQKKDFTLPESSGKYTQQGGKNADPFPVIPELKNFDPSAAGADTQSTFPKQ